MARRQKVAETPVQTVPTTGIETKLQADGTVVLAQGIGWQKKAVTFRNAADAEAKCDELRAQGIECEAVSDGLYAFVKIN